MRKKNPKIDFVRLALVRRDVRLAVFYPAGLIRVAFCADVQNPMFLMIGSVIGANYSLQ